MSVVKLPTILYLREAQFQLAVIVAADVEKLSDLQKAMVKTGDAKAFGKSVRDIAAKLTAASATWAQIVEQIKEQWRV